MFLVSSYCFLLSTFCLLFCSLSNSTSGTMSVTDDASPKSTALRDNFSTFHDEASAPTRKVPRSSSTLCPSSVSMHGVITCVLAIGVAALTIFLIRSDAQGTDRSANCALPPLPSVFRVEMPLTVQTTSYTCGPGSLTSVLQGYGFADVTEMSLAAEMNTNDVDGTLWSQMVNASVSRLLCVTSSNNLTISEVYRHIFSTKGCVIVAYQAYKFPDNNATWTNDWIDGHYSVIVGWNETGVLLMDPSQDPGMWGYIPTEEFLSRWHDIDGCCSPVVNFGMLISSPTKTLPATPSWPENVNYTW